MSEPEPNPWDLVLEHLRIELEGEEFRRWFQSTAYASDAGDQITVWAPTESVRRHLMNQYSETIERALAASGRTGVLVRFVVAGLGEEEE